jgi:hypothetical protein
MEEQAKIQPKPRVRKSGCGCGGGRKRQVMSERKETASLEEENSDATTGAKVKEVSEVLAAVETEESDVNIQPAEVVSEERTDTSRQAPMQTVTQFLAQITKSRPRTKRKHK